MLRPPSPSNKGRRQSKQKNVLSLQILSNKPWEIYHKQSEIVLSATQILEGRMKHAYLIIAHNEFEVLKKLLQAIDDQRNDVFLHFDAKVKQIPEVAMQHAGLFILENRIDVRWGHVSQIKAEYALFEAARHVGNYRYYHLISGTHLPLQSQDRIHDFYNNHADNQEVLMPMPVNEYQINLKMRRYNFFIKQYQHPNTFVRRFAQQGWKMAIKAQRILHIQRNRNATFKIAANWVSLTERGVERMLSKKKEILKKYRFTLCGDEWFVPSELENSILKPHLLYYDRLLKHSIEKATAKTWHLKDYEELIHSGCLFARKFGREDMEAVDKILNHIQSMQ